MIKSICLALVMSLPLLARADDKPQPKPDPAKKPEKKPIETFIDPAKAGADFAFQGEYVGMRGDDKIACQVVAEGDGAFYIRGLKGGLPGDGWDGEKRVEFKGKLEDGKVVFSDDKHQCTIADGKISVKAGDETFSLTKVTRKSPAEGMKPPEGAIVLFDGTNVDQWTKPDGKTPATWVVEGGILQVKGGDVLSKAKFAGPHTIHIEFNLPFMPRARSGPGE